jgi:NitT/TauT family transport system ATP-binding protein
VLFVTHDRSEAIQLGTRILRLAPGKASVAQDVVVNLTEGERRDRATVLAEQNRIFAAT